MTISQALQIANSGLAAASRRASVTSNNIANALTEGYNRRDAIISERIVDGRGAGVQVSGVSRASSPALTFERRQADSQLAFDSAGAGALTRVSNALGGPEDPNALFQRFADFESSLRTLADTPDSATLQLQGVNRANDLANAFNRISDDIQKVRFDADREIGNRVNVVNDALDQIEKLNDAIIRANTSGGDVNALIDQRERLIDTINENIPVNVLQREQGRIELATPEGVFLLAGEARKIDFNPAPVISATSAYDGGAGALSGLSVNGKDLTPGGPGLQNFQLGAIAGLFNVRDNVVPEQAAALDALAFDLVGRFQDPAVDTSLNAGDAGLFTDAGAAADVANITGLASRLTVNANVDPAAGGEARRLRDGVNAATPVAAGSEAFVRALVNALSDSRPTHAALQSPGNVNASEAAAHLTSLAGGARVSAVSRASASEVLAQNLSEAETLETAVDTDRELQNLIIVEQAYAANARVLETLDQLIRRLMEL